MKKLLIIPILCLVAYAAYAITVPFVITVGGVEAPGPSATLFASPVYTCTTNYYVATAAGGGSDSNNGTSPGTPWLTVGHANGSAHGGSGTTAGDCINVASGTYNSGSILLTHGGTSAAANGFVVYRSTTMNGAKLVGNSVGGPFVGFKANYFIFDGFEVDGSSNTAQLCFVTGLADVTFAAHHIYLFNNTGHDCGLSGAQLNEGDWYTVVHNSFYNNSSTNGNMGSGISMLYPNAGITGAYTPTGLDLTYSPFHIVVAYNYNHDNCNCISGATDGNGYIADRWTAATLNPAGDYNGGGLILGNAMIHNGGKGIQLLGGNNMTVANNTVYNNNWDTFNTGIERNEINLQYSKNIVVQNNIAWTVLGAGVLAQNGPIGSDTPPSANTYSNNIGLDGSGTATWAGPYAGPSTGKFNSPDVFSCSTNKCTTDPLWVNKAVSNFALQGGSSAIAYGTTGTYYPPAPVDAGACHHSLTTCP